ncbi:glycosyltransferase [Frankia sp. Cj3]|uniref:glycosyltransferase family 2 protein n=1 Tax=Frankia sp. Cj3 TaxID=2880976 RepID=UPI001EF5D925|nr:glycosyltransferase [Frankia sp. Cj3]
MTAVSGRRTQTAPVPAARGPASWPDRGRDEEPDDASWPAACASVVICAYTEERWADLERAVTSLSAQTVPPHEVIVVIDHNPRLHQRAAAGLSGVQVVLNSGRNGLSGARNTGIATATGDVIAFLDDDAEAEPSWLANLLAPYADPAVAGVGGLAEPRWPSSRPPWFPPEFDWVVGCSYQGLPTASAPVRNPIGAGMSFRRMVFDQVGGFTDGLGRLGSRPLGCEETELAIRLRAHDPTMIMLYQPLARVSHRVTRERTTWRYFRARCYAEGLSKAAVAHSVGRDAALASEKDYVRRVLPRALCRDLATPRRWPRASVTVAGLGITTAGYVHGRWLRWRRPGSPARLPDEPARRSDEPRHQPRGCPSSLPAATVTGLARGPAAHLAHAVSGRRGRQAARTAPAATTARIWCGEVELTEPMALPAELLDTAATPYREARLLIRLHGTPLGFLSVDLDTDVLDDLTLRAMASRDLGEAIRAHLGIDGLDQLPGPDPDPEPPACPAPAGPLAAGHACRRLLSAPAVSVVVCTRDRPAQLAASLVSLRALDWPWLDVIIVDNAPTDPATRSVFDAQAAGDPRFRYVLEPRPGLSRARNAGLTAASSTIVAFTDDDVTVDADWIRGLVRGFERRPDVACVTGLVAAATLASPAERYFDARVSWATNCRPALFDLDRSRRPSPLYPYSAGAFGTGANMAFRRDVLLALGGFDEALGAGTASAGGEDLDVFVRVLLAGHALAYEPAALVWHSHRAELDALRRQLFGYGTGLTSFLCKYLLDPATARGLLVAVPAGIGHLRTTRRRTGRAVTASAGGTRGPLAAGHRLAGPAALPMRRLWLRELAGMAAGPVCYLRSRHQAAHDRPLPPAPAWR